MWYPCSTSSLLLLSAPLCHAPSPGDCPSFLEHEEKGPKCQDFHSPKVKTLQSWLRWHHPAQEPSADTSKRGKQGSSHTSYLQAVPPSPLQELPAAPGMCSSPRQSKHHFAGRMLFNSLPRNQQNQLLPSSCLRMQPAAAELVPLVAV